MIWSFMTLSTWFSCGVVGLESGSVVLLWDSILLIVTGIRR